MPALSSLLVPALISTAPDPALKPVDSLDKTIVSTGLLEVLAAVPDPRQRRGRRHSLAAVLALGLAATLAGARSFAAIAHWATDAPTSVLAGLGARTAPSEPTIRRLFSTIDGDGLDRAIGAWMWLRTSMIAGRRVIAFDGKALRGARDDTGNLPFLLAGLCQLTGTILAQIGVGAKSSEVPGLRKLLATLDIADAVVTADAAHCCRETAETITTAGGHYILTVKKNQPLLRARLKTLPWKHVPVADVSTDTGHGRRERRTLKVTAIDAGIGFPGAEQVLRMTRTRTDRKTGKRGTEIIYAITTLTAIDASATMIATWLRGHWGIENRVHWVRDVSFDEDRCRARTGHAPQVLATLRNTAISLARLVGHTNIAAALRHYGHDYSRPFELLMTC